MPMQMAPAGMLQLKQRAAQGDPQAIEMLQALGAMPPQGQPSMGSTGPSMAPQAPPQGDMTQSQFGNGGMPVSPDEKARRAAQLIKMLRARQ